jgi:hypothetical protein
VRLQNFLPVPVFDGVVVENQRHQRKAEDRLGTHHREVSDSIDLNLDGNRYLLLHFLGGVARPLADDRHVVVGDVGIGLNRQAVEGKSAPEREKQADREHNESVVQCKIYESADHPLIPV